MMSNRTVPLPERHSSSGKGSPIFDSFRKNVDSFKRSFKDSLLKSLMLNVISKNHTIISCLI